MSENSLDVNKITANVISSLATSVAKSIIKKTGEVIKDTSNKVEIAIGRAYINYLNRAKESHELIKTILYRHEPKYIYSFFECINLRYQHKDIDTSDINNVLNVGNKIIITGTGGVGKSVMMKHFFLNAIINTKCVPVFIELRGLNDFEINEICLTDYIYETMKKFSLDFEKTYFNYSLETGNYIFLFDGFDEVKREISQKVTRQIIDMSDKYPKNHYIVSSRPLDGFGGWNSFQELSPEPLTKSQALSLINKLDYDPSVKERFYKKLDESLFVNYNSFASNPLLLTIMLLTYERKSSIPDKLNDFYEQAFGTLFFDHDALKNYERDIRSKLGYEEFKRAFSYFCFKSFFSSDFSFSKSKALGYIETIKQKQIIDSDFKSEDFLEDLTGSVCVLIHDGLDYKFTHRSFQEYFAAVYTMQLDDSSQSKLLKLWIEKSLSSSESGYLDILYELQPDRYIKNVLIAPINEMEKLSRKNNNSELWLFCLLYDEISIRSDNSEKASFSLRICNAYYYRIIKNAFRISNKENHTSSYINPGNRDKLAEIIKTNFGTNRYVKLKELINQGYEDELLSASPWIKHQFDVAVNFVNSKKKELSPNKNSLSSLLEDL